ncbi:SseB family protein [Yinghuangia sp. YIM S09857]|uniref:SseB family protein n=1 Tax=Yinghuangia sp. YIM S09857 TaxID=3436929 RepID=UPI003F5361DA
MILPAGNFGNPRPGRMGAPEALISDVVYGYATEEPQVRADGPSLTDAVRGFATGLMSGEDFQSVFIASKVFCPRGERPGFLALHNTPEPVIPMFSSLEELKRYAGEESRHFTVTGAEVLDLLPNGYGFVLDLDGEHRVMFDAKAIEQMINFAMRRMYG